MKASKKTPLQTQDLIPSLEEEVEKFLSTAHRLNFCDNYNYFSSGNSFKAFSEIKLHDSISVLKVLLRQDFIEMEEGVEILLMLEEREREAQEQTPAKKTHLLQERGDGEIPSIRRVPGSDKVRNSQTSTKQENTIPIAAQVAVPQSQTAKSLSEYLASVKTNLDGSFHEHDIIEGLKQLKLENPVDEVFALIDNGISQEKAFSVLEKFHLSNQRRESAEKSTKKYDHLLAIGNYIDGVITHIQDQSQELPELPAGVTVEDLEKDPMLMC